MKDMTKASNPFYLALFLLIVCGVSTLVMAYVAVKTDAPIKASQAKETAESLKMILPPFDNNPAEKTLSLTSPDGAPVKLYVATKDGQVVGYAAESGGGPRHRHESDRPLREAHHLRRREGREARHLEAPAERRAGFLLRREARRRKMDQGKGRRPLRFRRDLFLERRLRSRLVRRDRGSRAPRGR